MGRDRYGWSACGWNVERCGPIRPSADCWLGWRLGDSVEQWSRAASMFVFLLVCSSSFVVCKIALNESMPDDLGFIGAISRSFYIYLINGFVFPALAIMGLLVDNRSRRHVYCVIIVCIAVSSAARSSYDPAPASKRLMRWSLALCMSISAQACGLRQISATTLMLHAPALVVVACRNYLSMRQQYESLLPELPTTNATQEMYTIITMIVTILLLVMSYPIIYGSSFSLHGWGLPRSATPWAHYSNARGMVTRQKISETHIDSDVSLIGTPLEDRHDMSNSDQIESHSRQKSLKGTSMIIDANDPACTIIEGSLKFKDLFGASVVGQSFRGWTTDNDFWSWMQTEINYSYNGILPEGEKVEYSARVKLQPQQPSLVGECLATCKMIVTFAEDSVDAAEEPSESESTSGEDENANVTVTFYFSNVIVNKPGRCPQRCSKRNVSSRLLARPKRHGAASTSTTGRNLKSTVLDSIAEE